MHVHHEEISARECWGLSRNSVGLGYQTKRQAYHGRVNFGASSLLSFVPASTVALRNGQALAAGVETPPVVRTPARPKPHWRIAANNSLLKYSASCTGVKQ